jgi:hypothetical protein
MRRRRGHSGCVASCAACARGRRSSPGDAVTELIGPGAFANGYAVSVAFTPSCVSIACRILNFCTLPVTVIGNSVTNFT